MPRKFIAFDVRIQANPRPTSSEPPPIVRLDQGLVRLPESGAIKLWRMPALSERIEAEAVGSDAALSWRKARWRKGIGGRP
jgi:hypothetical protein